MPACTEHSSRAEMQCTLATSVWELRSIIQFQYGDDGLDITRASFVRQFNFLARNMPRCSQALDLPGAEAASQATGLEAAEARAARLKR